MKSSATREGAGQGLSLEIRELGGRSRKETDRPPFSYQLGPKTIDIKVPTFARVSVQDEWRWVDIHNGQHWGVAGVRVPHTKLEFSFPNQTAIRISAHGRVWLLRLRPGPRGPRRSSVGATLRSSRYLLGSIIAHMSVLGLLWYGVNQNFDLGNSSSENAKALKEKPKPQAAAAGEGGGMPASRPFEGMTYTEYTRRVEAAKREANPLGYLAQSLNKMKVKEGVGKGKGAGIQSATGVIGSGVGTGSGTSLTDAVSSQKFSVQSSGGTAGGKQITEKQKLALREKFRELQDDFKRIYSRLLSQDPNLSVTVAFQTKVQANGYLELSDFKARGTYLPETLPQLKSAMAEVLRSVYVGPELGGLTLRAENVFVR